MKTLLEFYLKYFDFLYLDPHYRITNSRTGGVATINASLTLTGPLLSWQLANDRGQMQFYVAPTKLNAPENWFRLPVIRQHLDGYDETNRVPAEETVAWIRDNLGRIEDLFSDSSAVQSCKAVTELENANAIKYFGPPKT
ncbi:hypothetical protein [Mycobacterium kyorinense]|uniref:hypothetical protein n=1 Tax=Mycobacterium kyorinense TaxID=487514 RepID=UPI0009DF1741|nr:hypothetical protein [Mycobacterium kyorinense]